MIIIVRDFLCQLAGDLLYADRSKVSGQWDLDNPLRPREQRREDYLTLLQVGRSVNTALEFNTEMAESRAQRNGAGFGEIGAALGISRQAARQAHKRRTTEHTVTLVGGPRDGSTAQTTADTAELSYAVRDPFFREHPWLEDEELPSVIYRRKYGSPAVFEFVHFTSHDGKIIAEPDVRPRVYDLAKAWDLDSRTILARASDFTAGLRSPSSRVDRATFEQLRAIFMGRPEGVDDDA
jgi:hypothetical protein